MDGEPMMMESVPVRLHGPLMLNHRIEMNNFGHMRPRRQLLFQLQALPWLQAIYELRMRQFVNPHITPRWWAHETELETHGFNLDKSSGVIAVMNHEPDTVEQEIAFETKALGLKRGRPAWVWRMRLPHPHQVDYRGVTGDSPIRRLAVQKLAAFHQKLPAKMGYRESWPSDTPVLLLVTQSPALLESVDGKACQLWLPEAYDVRITGVQEGEAGRIDLRVRNRHETAGVLVPLTGDRTPAVSMRRLEQMHEAGVLPAFEKVDREIVERDGQRFCRFVVPRGTQEIVVQ
jgi:hypothetical protein